MEAGSDTMLQLPYPSYTLINVQCQVFITCSRSLDTFFQMDGAQTLSGIAKASKITGVFIDIFLYSVALTAAVTGAWSRNTARNMHMQEQESPRGT